MRLQIPSLGLDFALAPRVKSMLQTISSSGGWFPIVSEPRTGAWQRNESLTRETELAYFAVYACITLIAGDIGKMRLTLIEEDANGIENEVEVPAFSPFIRQQNGYQTRAMFFEWWMVSKLVHGNVYALKQRDQRGVVIGAYILDPTRVQVLIAPDGSVFYRLSADNLSGLQEPVTVPAREMFHDMVCPLYHPLCGVSPIVACASGILQGLKIQENQTNFAAAGSQPGGVVSSPNFIPQEVVDRVQKYWEENYAGPENAGRVAVLGNGLGYTPLAMVTAQAGQVIEQLRFTAEIVCGCFHVPLHKVLGSMPPNYNNIEALDQQYYSQCLQIHTEKTELVFDKGMGLGKAFGNTYGTRFDLDDLLRMDSQTKMTVARDGVLGGIFMPDEARGKFNLKAVDGGDTVFMQSQNWPLSVLAKRDQADLNPVALNQPPPNAPETPSPPEPPSATKQWTKNELIGSIVKHLRAA